ncbi:metal-sulfur cluster assembly factor [Actinoplanes sp. NBC_00393]
MTDKTDTAQTVATAPGSATDPSVDEVPAWLAAERAEAAEGGEPVEVPSAAVSEAAVSESAVSAAAVSEAAISAAASSEAADKPAVTKKASVADVEEAMKDVVDPELGINVVDLGLVYGTHIDDDNVATLDMTLTSAACPLTDVIEDQTRQALTTGPGGGLVQDFRINWVWLPPWGPDKITDDGREQLRALGFNV